MGRWREGEKGGGGRNWISERGDGGGKCEDEEEERGGGGEKVRKKITGHRLVLNLLEG
jgi:hypothetical protein